MCDGAIELFASFAVLGELCVKECLLARGDSFNAKLAKDRKAREEFYRAIAHPGATIRSELITKSESHSKLNN